MKISIIKRRDGTLAYCPIVRDQNPDETDAQFFHACTRRVLMEELFNDKLGTAADEVSRAAALALANAADKDGTLRAQCEALGVEIGGIADDAILPEGDKDEFRPAWMLANKRTVNGLETCEIGRDMPKCREIHRAKLRELRRPLFVENDLAIRDAQIDGDAVKLAAAVARRNALRDVTADPAIEAAQTPEELKAIMPKVLTERGLS